MGEPARGRVEGITGSIFGGRGRMPGGSGNLCGGVIGALCSIAVVVVVGCFVVCCSSGDVGDASTSVAGLALPGSTKSSSVTRTGSPLSATREEERIRLDGMGGCGRARPTAEQSWPGIGESDALEDGGKLFYLSLLFVVLSAPGPHIITTIVSSAQGALSRRRGSPQARGGRAQTNSSGHILAHHDTRTHWSTRSSVMRAHPPRLPRCHAMQ